MARVSSRSALRMRATNSFWFLSKTLELEFPLTKRARYSTLSLPPRSTAQGWGCVSAERSLRPTVAGYGLPTTTRAERVFTSRWLSPRTLRVWTPGATPDLLREFGFADRAFSPCPPNHIPRFAPACKLPVAFLRQKLQPLSSRNS